MTPETGIIGNCELIIFLKDRLMETEQRRVANHRLQITYDEYLNMGEDLRGYAIGTYIVTDLIGTGAFGRVYLGYSQSTLEAVAIKTVDLQRILTQYKGNALEKVLKMANSQDILMRICKSPNIVKCHEVFESKELKIIVMEYCQGGSLQQFINKKGRIGEKQALKIFKHILNGISEMHSHSIVHRDLKADNILMHYGIVKIADFGFSKQLKEGNSITIVGTRPYTAPEIMKGERYGLKADIWSAAVVLYQMIFGDFPFKQQEKENLIYEIETNQMHKQVQLSANGYTATAEISNFLKKMLVINPARRMGWQQLINHPLLALEEEQKLPRELIPDYQINPPSQIEVSPSMMSKMQQSYSSLLLRVEAEARDSTDIIIKKVSQKSILLKKKNNRMTEEDCLYLSINQNLIECLKNELIYQEVIAKLEGKQMLDMTERVSIELIYLLSSRCFLNLSPIKLHMEKTKGKHLFVEQIYSIVNKLYSQMNLTFLKYSHLLTEEEGRLVNRFQDFFLTSKQELELYEKFLNGIQNKDYTKQQQLKFIQDRYINQIIKQQGLKGSRYDVEKVEGYLKNYCAINLIAFQTLSETNFDRYVEALIKQ